MRVKILVLVSYTSTVSFYGFTNFVIYIYIVDISVREELYIYFSIMFAYSNKEPINMNPATL